jgi:hypothetical protein
MRTAVCSIVGETIVTIVSCCYSSEANGMELDTETFCIIKTLVKASNVIIRM